MSKIFRLAIQCSLQFRDGVCLQLIRLWRSLGAADLVGFALPCFLLFSRHNEMHSCTLVWVQVYAIELLHMRRYANTNLS